MVSGSNATAVLDERHGSKEFVRNSREVLQQMPGGPPRPGAKVDFVPISHWLDDGSAFLTTTRAPNDQILPTEVGPEGDTGTGQQQIGRRKQLLFALYVAWVLDRPLLLDA